MAGDCTMSESRSYDGANWRDNPDEFKAPVRRGVDFLGARGYRNPEIAALKFGLADEIQRAASRLRLTSRTDIALRLEATGLPMSQADLSALLNGNVTAFSLERLMQIAAALGTNVIVRSAPSRSGVGRVQAVRARPRRRPEVAVAASR